MRTAFNSGLGASLAAAAPRGRTSRTGGQVGRLAVELVRAARAATAAYFLVNTGLVTLAISFQQRTPFLVVWRESFEWTAVSYFTGLTLAVCMLGPARVGPWVLALGIPPCSLLLAFYPRAPRGDPGARAPRPGGRGAERGARAQGRGADTRARHRALEGSRAPTACSPTPTAR
jgi:hypothetical protein